MFRRCTLLSDTMKTQYDEIGADYFQTKMIRWKRYAEPHALFQALGSLAGKRLIDVPCGDGYFIQHLALMGAREVVGLGRAFCE